jgi:catechol 2,3-dioxygenase-like lactoylglutathione lyase family enzyme
MGIGITKLNHVNVTVPAALEEAAKRFYGPLLGLQEILKPAGTRQSMGAWYQLGDGQLHLSVEDDVDAAASDRHVCYQVSDAESAKLEFVNAGIAIIPDPRPRQGRFFVRDPGGNLLEITEG